MRALTSAKYLCTVLMLSCLFPLCRAFIFAVQIAALTVYPVLIAPLFNKFDPLPPGALRCQIEELASSLKFPLTKLYVVDGSTRSAHSNVHPS